MSDDYYRLSPAELAVGWVPGVRPTPPFPHEVASPIQALEAAIRPALLKPPCLVAFSGGRDSSALLAVAVRLARREGLPEPVPITERYPDAPDTDESVWQQEVIDHLGIREWIRLELRGEHDMLGDLARGGLAKRGLVWPPACHLAGTMHQHATGGSLITGEGGDEVLGARRITPLVRALRRRERPTRARLVGIAEGIAPQALRRRRLFRYFTTQVAQPWVRQEVRLEVLHQVAANYATQPLAWNAGAWWLLRRESTRITSDTATRIASEYGVALFEPLLDRDFIAAVARMGGRLGYTSRNELMGLLFGDVLPLKTTSRASKVAFNAAYTGEQTKQFARDWDGSGLDDRLVDPEALRAEWLAESPSGLSFGLLHAAWLARQGVSPTPLDVAS